MKVNMIRIKRDWSRSQLKMLLLTSCALLLLRTSHVSANDSEVIWAILGHPLTLSCDSDESCSWSNAQNLKSMLQAMTSFRQTTTSQKRRFVDDKSCKMEINSVAESDVGTWECLTAGNSKKYSKLAWHSNLHPSTLRRSKKRPRSAASYGRPSRGRRSAGISMTSSLKKRKRNFLKVNHSPSGQYYKHFYVDGSFIN